MRFICVKKKRASFAERMLRAGYLVIATVTNVVIIHFAHTEDVLYTYCSRPGSRSFWLDV